MSITNDTRIGILAGGPSLEREISLRSGRMVEESLQRQGYQTVFIDPITDTIDPQKIDIAFIALHGKYGEDGTIQSTLESLNIPYTGSGVTASNLAINKLASKQVMHDHNIPTPNHCFPNQLTLPIPFIIKPIAEGSSIGIEIIHHHSKFEEWRSRTPNITDYFIETYISGPTISVGIIEQDQQPLALPVLECRSKREFYDYTAKYTDGETELIVPADLPADIRNDAQTLSAQLHTAIGCRGFSRVDLIVDPKQGPLVLELNTIPGLTALSDLPAQANAAGISYDALILQLLHSSQ